MDEKEQLFLELYRLGYDDPSQLSRDFDKFLDEIPDSAKDDGNANFWRFNDHLLDVTEDWCFDYSDMGYRDTPQF